jgi:Cof subfamily protein (haloacid dehalogenase superfamily)
VKTLITLDIDGTITNHHSEINKETVELFHNLYEEGFEFAFITGRTFQWGYQVLKQLSIPYYFAIHNGAIILEMPSRNILMKRYLDRSVCSSLDEICETEPTDYVIYGGYEVGDICYYRPSKFDQIALFYVQERIAAIKEEWRPLDSYDNLPIDSFASIKCFGNQESAVRISSKIQERLNLHAPINRDPFNHDHFVVQATHPLVDKGAALLTLKSLVIGCEIVVAAGDDRNDIPMLEKADIAIGMETAPQELLDISDIIAPAASKDGIIEGLRQAIEKIHGRR